MPRPKTILWVDDEVDGLAAHRRFLEEQGFVVEQAAHGDDALALLRRQPYSVVLLDEQMPGRRGLELLGEIRAIDPAMPVVMVTQSEDAGDAAGGDRRRSGRLPREAGASAPDPLGRHAAPRGRPHPPAAALARLRDPLPRARGTPRRRDSRWREWIELVVELVRWEVRLSAGERAGPLGGPRRAAARVAPGLRRVHRRHYPRWLAQPEGDRPPLSVDVGAEFLVPILQTTSRALFVVVDCLRLDQWEALRDARHAAVRRRGVATTSAFCPRRRRFPATRSSRACFPMEIAARHPDWWGKPSDEESLNATSRSSWSEQLEDLMGHPVPVRYEKLFSAADGARPAAAAAGAPGAGRRDRAGVQLHRPAHPRPLRERDPVRGGAGHRGAAQPRPAPGSSARRCSPRCEEAERRSVPVLLTTDHGSIHCETPATVFAKRDATANLRYKFGEDLRAEDPEAAIAVDDLQGLGPAPARPRRAAAARDSGDRFFVYPTKLREYQARYRGSFLHGGVTSRRGDPAGRSAHAAARRTRSALDGRGARRTSPPPAPPVCCRCSPPPSAPPSWRRCWTVSRSS